MSGQPNSNQLPLPSNTASQPEKKNSPRTQAFLDTKGVVLLAKRNKKKRFFLPDSENLFGGHKVPAVMVDSGCNSILLPLAKDEIKSLPSIFPPSKFYWSFKQSKGVADPTFVLLIRRKGVVSIPIKLCQSLRPGVTTFEVTFLRFHICQEDAEVIKTTQALRNCFQFVDDQFPTSFPVTRRKHALLGQAIFGKLDTLAAFQFRKFLAFVDLKEFVLSPNCFEPLEAYVLRDESLPLPANFDDLEDEDHESFDDDEEEEYELDEDDCIDE